ncbi:MAG: o-succinylbenzoate synthase [Ignavibacteriae bacterium]|nr:MAG: o-succinylbenzoate synthase [Ignavibacteriota bacterium]
MRFKSIEYKLFNFKLTFPFYNSQGLIDSKNVLLLKAKDENNNIHFGEVSPLSGFSKEKINDCVNELNYLIQNKLLFCDLSELKQNLQKLVSLPSLLFGIEQLIFSREFTEQNNYSKQNKVVNINAIIGLREKDSVIKELDNLFNLGFRTFKIKIGRKNFCNDLSILNSIHKKYGQLIKLRLDNNASWSYEEAKRNIKELNNFNIEFIEQPVKSEDEIIELAGKSKINIAVDESLNNYKKTKKLLKENYINYFIVKPSIRIGLFDTMKLIDEANKLNKNIIISSAYETIIGKATLFYLASLCKHNFGHGLNTEVLGNNFFKKSNSFSNYFFETDNLNFNHNLTPYF